VTTTLSQSIRPQVRTIDGAAREDYLASYAGERFAESMRYVQTYPEELPILRGLLPTIETPVQILAGARDVVVPPVSAEFLHERLPKSKLDFIDAGHFIWEDGADRYAELVTSWWAGGYATQPGKMQTFPAATVPDTLHDVDFMVKDSKRFADSGGWGWECGFSCHTIVKTRDFVFTDYGPR
jgi:hypothetical protein